ncbi:MAG: hypothetical protein Q9187_005714 [Circinaria calcarea]
MICLPRKSEKVYFDGFLPPWKRAIRISRLESYLRQLTTFRSLHPSGIGCRETASEPGFPNAEELFASCKPLPNNWQGLPASPFLVPAILDALCTSQFADVVEVVPAEADSFCADAVCKLGGIVLTGDSDLLAHDLGKDGGVVFFNQFGLRTLVDSGCHVVAAPISRPFAIAKQLNVSSISRLAFELKIDSTITLPEATRRARQSPEDTVLYENFLAEYTKYGSSAKVPASLLDTLILGLEFMDPRISEMVLQFHEPGEEVLRVYLPFLIDDPSRISAWDASSDLRCFAYSLLSLGSTIGHKSVFIHEYGRRGNRIVYHEVKMISPEMCTQYAKTMLDRLMAIRAILYDMPEFVQWRVFSISMVMCWYADNGRTPPLDECLLMVLGGAYVNTIKWEIIQLSAQSQAVMYSLRLIQKIMRYLVHHTSTTLDIQLMEVWKVLQKLPSLDRAIPSRLELLKEHGYGLELDKMLDLVKEAVGLVISPPYDQIRDGELVHGVDPEWQLPKRRRTSKRKLNSPASKKPSVNPTNQIDNIYSVLANT